MRRIGGDSIGAIARAASVRTRARCGPGDAPLNAGACRADQVGWPHERGGGREMRRAGFTLVELMVVVAIVGVLSVVAIPAFMRFQMRAKSVEAGVNLQAIAKAQESYFAEYGTYVSASVPVPATIPGAMKAGWPGSAGFSTLGWDPEGAVHFQYVVYADSPGGGNALIRYTAEAAGDLDSNGTPSFYAFVKPEDGAGSGIAGMLPGTTCLATGVYSGGSSGALSTAGPCDTSSGQSRF
jgi:prepilin-type N-terminal cleavage/methylation domain-containing protein